MQLTGIHHLTAISANAKGNVDFYTRVLGLRLVKKTVNQDDVSAYHLFYADGLASPGSDLTFFDWPAAPERRGTNSIVRTALRVTGEATLQWWAKRLTELGTKHSGVRTRDGRASLHFEDPEGQRLALVDDGGRGAGNPWEKSPVPAEHQIRGLGPITMSVPDLSSTDLILRELMFMRPVREYDNPPLEGGVETTKATSPLRGGRKRGSAFGRGSDERSSSLGEASDGRSGSFNGAGSRVHVYEMGEGGPAAELHVAVEPDASPARQGAGGVHHVAFRTPDETEYDAWAKRLRDLRIPNSGPVDRFYFRSLYFREPNGILFEIATDGPGFATDEPLEHLGERLALPPFLEPRRASIEAGLKPL